MGMETVLITLFMPKCSFLCTRNFRLHLCVEVKYCNIEQSHTEPGRQNLQRMSSVLGAMSRDLKVNLACLDCSLFYKIIVNIYTTFLYEVCFDFRIEIMTLRQNFPFQLNIWARFYADFHLVQSHQRLFIKMTAFNTVFFPLISQSPKQNPTLINKLIYFELRKQFFFLLWRKTST